MDSGSTFAGRFTIERVAGSGGMGTVYCAVDAASGERVALKVLAGKTDSDTDRFAREATTLAKLDDPAIVHYVAHGVFEEQRWIAMQWLDGTSLGAALEVRRPTVAETIELGLRIAGGLGHAHRHGIVHRDIKPSNILLAGGSFDEAKIVDFGIARPTESGQTVTATGAAIGTPGYMAPEQARGTKIDARADVFSFGCVLYCCLTGQSPFSAEDPLAAMLRLAVAEVARPSELCEGIPEALDDLVVKMLERSPMSRPTDGDAVHAALLAIRERPGSIVGAAPRTRGTVGATCLLLIRSGAAPTGDEASELERREHDLRAEVERFGATLEFLPDRSMYVLVTGKEPATQLATRAARAALVLDAALPTDFPMALVSVWDSQEGSPEEVAIGRAVRLLRTGTREGIAVDDAVATLLGAKFELVQDATGTRMVGEGTARSRAAPAPPATSAAAPTVRKRIPPWAVIAGIVVIGAAAVGGAAFGISRVVTRRSAPSAEPPPPAAQPARHPPPTPANPSPGPAARPAPASTGMSIECHEYMKTLECIYRSAPRAFRENLVKQARDDLRGQPASFCKMHMAGIASSARGAGCSH